MIHVINTLLKDYEVHLASTSPRRSSILKNVDMQFQVTPSTFIENLDKSSFARPEDYCIENAKQKALDVMQKLKSGEVGATNKIIIGTDTVIVAENRILEKPKNHENAYAMLKRLNELKSHQVCSGVVLVKSDNGGVSIREFHNMTCVEFGDNPDEAIRAYADSDEPLDKAGGYGIQGVGGTLVEKIDGCYYNVMGFPLYQFCKEVYQWLK